MNKTTVNDSAAVFAAICISFIALGGFLILPLFVGAAAEDMGMTEQQIGFFASSVMAGASISSVVALFWIRHVDWHKAAYVALGTLFVAHSSCLFMDQLAPFILLQFIAGLGGGAAYSLVLTVLSDNRKPERCFGFSVAAQVSFQVIGLLLLPSVIARGGLDVVLAILAGMALLGLILLHWLPRAGAPVEQLSIRHNIFKPRVFLALGGCFMYFMNVGVVWTFIERMGVAEGFSAEFIGLSLAAGVAFGVPGALFASWCGGRFGQIGPLILGAAATLLSLIMLRQGMSSASYFLALALYNFGWNFSLTFQYSAVSKVDESGRGLAVAPAFHGAGGATGPIFAAMYITSDSFIAVNLIAGMAVVLSLSLFALALCRNLTTRAIVQEN